MQLKLYGTGEYPQGEQHKQQQALDQMETSSSSRSSSRSSCLPIREIKTNRRRTLCNCCTICTISKVTHSAKTNTPAPAHSRKSSICVHDQNPGRDSVSVTVSQSQSQFLSGASSYSYSWSCLRHIMTVFPFLLPLVHSPFFHSLFSFSFVFFRVSSHSPCCIFLSLVTSALSCHSCSSCRVQVRLRVRVRVWIGVGVRVESPGSCTCRVA